MAQTPEATVASIDERRVVKSDLMRAASYLAKKHRKRYEVVHDLDSKRWALQWKPKHARKWLRASPEFTKMREFYIWLLGYGRSPEVL
jgi:hypothetical protein